MRLAFVTPLVTQATRPGWATVLRPFTVHSRRMGASHTVPAGFPFDWDSVPRIPGVHALTKGRAEKSACLHDHLYRVQAFDGVPISRRQADLLMFDAMKAEGTARRHRWLIYAGVRLGGWIGWRKHRRNAKEAA